MKFIHFRSSVILLLWIFTLGISFSGCGGESTGPNSGARQVPLDASPDSYRSKRWSSRSEVKIVRSEDGLRCVVQGETGKGPGPYGGIAFPAKGAARWSLELAFPDTGAIATVYVDGFNAQGKRVLRWEAPGKQVPRESRVYEFRPGDSPAPFKLVASPASGAVETVHVFVRIEPGGRATFELHRAETSG